MSEFHGVEQTWFEMAGVRRRRLSDAVWVPLRSAEWIGETGCSGYEGYRVEFFGLGSIAVPLARRADAEGQLAAEVAHGRSRQIFEGASTLTPRGTLISDQDTRPA